MFPIFHYRDNTLSFFSCVRLALFLAVGFAMNTHAGLAQSTKILVNVEQQKLFLYQGDRLLKSYDVSTAKNGVGNQKNSNKTPLGRHKIARKIGAEYPIGEVFIGRQAQNRVAEIVQQPISTGEDYILTRILWLDGLEKSFNNGGNVDTMSRYIYIHGTSEEGLIGQPSSHGCIRMRNHEVVELFDLVSVDSLVVIE